MASPGSKSQLKTATSHSSAIVPSKNGGPPAAPKAQNLSRRSSETNEEKSKTTSQQLKELKEALKEKEAIISNLQKKVATLEKTNWDLKCVRQLTRDDRSTSIASLASNASTDGNSRKRHCPGEEDNDEELNSTSAVTQELKQFKANVQHMLANQNTRMEEKLASLQTGITKAVLKGLQAVLPVLGNISTDELRSTMNDLVSDIVENKQQSSAQRKSYSSAARKSGNYTKQQLSPQEYRQHRPVSSLRNTGNRSRSNSSIRHSNSQTVSTPAASLMGPPILSTPIAKSAVRYNTQPPLITTDNTPQQQDEISLRPEWETQRSQRRRQTRKNITRNRSRTRSRSNTRTVRTAPKPNWGKPIKKNTALLLPKQEGVNAIQELRKIEIDPQELGFRGRTTFPSGAVLVTVKDEESAIKLRQAVANLGTIEAATPPKEKHAVLRVHDVPNSTPDDKIISSFEQKFGEKPLSLHRSPYHAADRAEIGVVILEITEMTYEVAKSIRRLRIGWESCRVTTKPRLTRCRKCNLLGHPDKFCHEKYQQAVDQVRQSHQLSSAESDAATPVSVSERCLDCEVFNNTLLKSPGSTLRKRETNHKTGSTNCPTRLRYYKKALPTKPVIQISSNTEQASTGHTNESLASDSEGAIPNDMVTNDDEHVSSNIGQFVEKMAIEDNFTDNSLMDQTKHHG